MELLKLYLSEADDFQEKYEPSLCSGTYCWISENEIVYNKDIHNIFEDINFEELTEDMTIGIEIVYTISEVK